MSPPCHQLGRTYQFHEDYRMHKSEFTTVTGHLHSYTQTNTVYAYSTNVKAL